MVMRVYAEKKPGFDVEAAQLLRELRDIVGVSSLGGLRLLNRYDVEGADGELFERCIAGVFSEPQVDFVYRTLDEALGAGAGAVDAGEGAGAAGGPVVFAVEYLPGQFDQRADSASECMQLISQGERPLVRSARVYILYGADGADGALAPGDVEAAKRFVINPVEAREAALELPETLQADYPEPAPVETIDGFTAMGDADLAAFIAQRGLAMDEADLAFCRSYFADEGREPTITEIKMIDTYWSDHCRHTTFGTELAVERIDDAAVEAAFARYLELRRDLGREEKPVCLMDMGTIGAKWLRAQGILRNLDESDEINACTVRITCDVDGQAQDWLYLFKNETHNHPTEIEPFGGAATCVGGAIRDPLSGRSYVYQAMRVTGAADPRVPVAQTLPGKLPQRKIVTAAAQGYSSYGNQIGLATGQVSELYHPGYAAKRMEIGAVVGAAPARNVRREEPAPGDVIVLLGGRTGRDGIGGATGSSKAHGRSSLADCGAEVQKGNAPVERKLQRLFRREDACRLIKRCNDFGAGGVSVAIGELADGLSIDLDRVPKKYDGLDGTELAISESQERMAVALAAADVDAFIGYAHEENLEATPVARVTDDARVRMTWNGQTIVDVSRSFLASNGAPKHQVVRIPAQGTYECPWSAAEADVAEAGAGEAEGAPSPACPGCETHGTGAGLRDRMAALLSDLNVCSNKGLSERFDSTIGAGTVLMPFGGARQLTPALAMVAKLPVFGETTTVSGMAWGFNPYLTSANCYEGAYCAVVESVARLVATGFRRADMYLTFQEYFEKLRGQAERWGKPAAAVLGALMAQIDLGVGAIGGKDSMSGSFEDFDVPPTLVSFATAVGSVDRVVSPEFKQAGSRVACIHPAYTRGSALPDARGMTAAMDAVEALVEAGAARAVSTCGYGCAAEALFKMCVGNGIGFAMEDGLDPEMLFTPAYGTFLVELADGASLPAAAEDGSMGVTLLGRTTAAYSFCAGGECVDGAWLQERWEGALEGVFPYRTCDGAADASAGAGVTAGASADVAAGADAPADAGTRVLSGYPLGSREDHDTAEGTPSPACSEGGCSGGSDASAAVGVAAGATPAAVPALSYADAVPLVYCGSIAKPRVIIPVFPGTNCEYDSARAFERAGASPRTLIVNNLTPDAVAESARALAAAIRESQIVMIPGGFSGGDEPEGSAKLICALFRAPVVTEAVRDLLQVRDGLMLGICNGFQALVKLGLVPFGDIRDADETCPTLTFNTIGRHQSRLVNTRVASNLSPWMSACTVGEVHTVAISHGEGRFVASDEMLAQLAAGGQVATQYADAAGVPGMGLDVNPNGSLLAIEGITSPDGRVFGKMGHSERSGAGLYKNVPGALYQPIFEGGVRYFA